MSNTLYIGTVISNADYAVGNNNQYLGRVLVQIPGLTQAEKVSMSYKTVGANTGGSLNRKTIEQIEAFENIWAYVLSPISGESSIGKYNRTKDASSLSDGVTMDNFTDDSNYSTPPASQFTSLMFDGHAVGPEITMSAGINPYGNCYVTENYSNSGKGMFSVPCVNSKVIVGFINGSRGIPIVLGKVHAGSEMEQIYGNGNAYPDYPNIFENTVASETKPSTNSTVVINTPQ